MTILYIPGKSCVFANALLCYPEFAATVVSIESGLLIQIHEAQAAASVDSWEQPKKAESACNNDFIFHDVLLYYTHNGNEVNLVIPEDAGLWKDLLWQCHNNSYGGYLGVHHMVGALSKQYWWKRLHADVKKYCKQCLVCWEAKVITVAPQGQLQPLWMPQYSFESITLDLVTYFPVTDYGHNVIYTVIDRLSKFTYFILCKHTVSVANLAQLFLANMVVHHGMPDLIVSNHDPRFTLGFQHSLISALGCKHSLSTIFQPETDGLSKRMRRSIEQILCC